MVYLITYYNIRKELQSEATTDIFFLTKRLQELVEDTFVLEETIKVRTYEN